MIGIDGIGKEKVSEFRWQFIPGTRRSDGYGSVEEHEIRQGIEKE